jgi:predicted DsbA family dithiol-disulfide isomerase
MAHSITLAHDPTCPWCWIGLFQAKRLREEFDVEINWVGYELWPAELPRPASSSVPEVETKRPPTPTRMELAYAAQGMDAPTAERPKGIVIHNALQVFELAKRHGVADEVVERVYRAFWEEGQDVSQPEVLATLTAGLLDEAEMRAVIEEQRFRADIVPFDDEAYARGVYNVPTFVIDGVKYAEQPYSVLARAVKAWIG